MHLNKIWCTEIRSRKFCPSHPVVKYCGKKIGFGVDSIKISASNTYKQLTHVRVSCWVGLLCLIPTFLGNPLFWNLTSKFESNNQVWAAVSLAGGSWHCQCQAGSSAEQWKTHFYLWTLSSLPFQYNKAVLILMVFSFENFPWFSRNGGVGFL